MTKDPFLFLPSNVTLPALQVTVTTDLSNDEVYANFHERGDPSQSIQGIQFYLSPYAFIISESDYRGVAEEFQRPPDVSDLLGLILQRIAKRAQRHNIPRSQWQYLVAKKYGTMSSSDQLVLPKPWMDPSITELVQKNFDSARQLQNTDNAVKLTDEAMRLAQEGHFRKAVRLFRLARREAPNLYGPCLGLAELAIKGNDSAAAQTLFKEATTLFKQDNDVSEKIKARDQRRFSDIEKLLRKPPVAVAHKETSLNDGASLLPLPTRPPSALLALTRTPVRVDAPLLQRLLSPDTADTISFYRLRLEAERLRLLGGFEELLAPARSRIQMFEHQIRAAQIVLQKMGGRALLADEVGLGKTVEAGLILKEYILRGMVKKALVLTPPSLVEQWREELDEKFGLVAKEADTSSDDRFWADEPLIVASLSLAKRDPHQASILNQHFDLLIVDEAHHLRNRKTAAWKFVNQMKYKYVLFLTATPVQNDLEEIYNLTTLLRPGQLGTPAQFSEQFKERGKPRTPKNPQALRDLLREVMIRHTRANTALTLPRRVPHVLSVSMSEAEHSAYQHLSRFIRQNAGVSNMSPFVLNLLLREAGSHLTSVIGTLEKLHDRCGPDNRLTLRRLVEELRSVTAHSKTAALLKIVEHSDRCLVFTEFRDTQTHVAAALKKAGHSVDLFHGGLTSAEKTEVLHRFENETRCLVSTPTGGEGVNLQFCRTLINYDLPWNPMKIEQRIGRLHRFGQTGDVFIHSLAATQTVEHQLLRLLHEKLNLFELVVGETETILGDMLEERDFESMLMNLWLEAANESDFEGRMEEWGRHILQKKAGYVEERQMAEHLFSTDYERA